MRRRSAVSPFLAICVFATAMSGCNDPNLFIPQTSLENPLDNKITLRGGFCAEGSERIQSVSKVLLILDRSNSMLVTDPTNRRITAAQDLVLNFMADPQSLTLVPNVEIGVLSFWGDIAWLTRNDEGLPGFSSDGASVLSGLQQIAQVSSNTGYDTALAEAFTALDRDMARLRGEVQARYDIIFFSDGLPFPENCAGEDNSPTNAVLAVQRIKELEALYETSITFNTAFASDPRMFNSGSDIDACPSSDPFEANFNDSIGQETRALLTAMASAGDGIFKQFSNNFGSTSQGGQAINFLEFPFPEGRRIFALSNFAVRNLNARPEGEGVVADSDGDGLLDREEFEIGSSPFPPDGNDTDGDGYNDGLEWTNRFSGFDLLDPTDADCANRRDTDRDFLRNCEETFVGTRSRRVDTDNDGIPDLFEVLGGGIANSSSPFQDRFADSDADGGSDYEELLWNTDPQRNDVAFRSEVAYIYNQRELPITDGRACYEFSVSNISLASTLGAPDAPSTATPQVTGVNRILLSFAQTPYDDPLGEPLFRLACVDARFVEERDLKIPAGGTFELPARRPSDTYRASNVLRPDSDAQCQVSNNQDCGLDTIWCRFDPGGACNCFRPPTQPGDPPNGFPLGACPACSDGQDNDGDGRTDFPNDPDCFDSLDTDESPNTACSDGQDNDGDGLIDFPNDPGCDSGYDTDETTSALTECSDGVDNNDDGRIDFPNDFGCDSASDPNEGVQVGTFACSDGLDNDGDGLVDLADAGCTTAQDVDEGGPSTCFFCENTNANRPNQCDIGEGYCRGTSGGACTTRRDCRGAPCINGLCRPCLRDSDCDSGPGTADGLCNTTNGWCLAPAYHAQQCTSSTDCGGTPCETDVGYCRVDPAVACRNAADCATGELCSEARGFCLRPVFETEQCDDETPCPAGTCDERIGWCLPDQGGLQCVSNDECPFGDCTPESYCDQQTFVFPENFDPNSDCIKAR